ncbi:hypothetical protein SAMN02910292_02697 [Lachnospiraceae bacterium XBB2008]|nr:hypothetical protein SAMN02910292_02697 [Lachnospiraceae bacterium XBB2008]
MIDELTCVSEGDVFISYVKDSQEKTIPFSAIKPLWNYADASEGEYSEAFVDDDEKTIWGLFIIASMQGGIIIGWDTEQDKVIHISEAAYAEDFDIYDGYVYSVCYVSNFRTKPRYEVFRTKVGTMDPNCKLEKVEDVIFEVDESQTERAVPAQISVDSNGVRVEICKYMEELLKAVDNSES